MENPKSEIRMTNQIRMTKSELIRHSSFGHSGLIPHSDFGIRAFAE